LTVLVLGIFIQQLVGRDCWWLKCNKFGPFCRPKFWWMLGKCRYRWVVLFLLEAVRVYSYLVSGLKTDMIFSVLHCVHHTVCCWTFLHVYMQSV
jgi:hypothetical protein